MACILHGHKNWCATVSNMYKYYRNTLIIQIVWETYKNDLKIEKLRKMKMYFRLAFTVSPNIAEQNSLENTENQLLKGRKVYVLLNPSQETTWGSCSFHKAWIWCPFFSEKVLKVNQWNHKTLQFIYMYCRDMI